MFVQTQRSCQELVVVGYYFALGEWREAVSGVGMRFVGWSDVAELTAGQAPEGSFVVNFVGVVNEVAALPVGGVAVGGHWRGCLIVGGGVIVVVVAAVAG
jgi:hypothetical protein